MSEMPSIYSAPRERVNVAGVDRRGRLQVSVINPKPIQAVDRCRLYEAAPELLTVLRSLAIRFELECKERGDGALFPGRALLPEMLRAIAVADGIALSYDETPPPVSGRPGCARGYGAPLASTGTAAKLADEAIGLFLEYRDRHGKSEADARLATVLEIAEGASADLTEMFGACDGDACLHQASDEADDQG